MHDSRPLAYRREALSFSVGLPYGGAIVPITSLSLLREDDLELASEF